MSIFLLTWVTVMNEVLDVCTLSMHTRKIPHQLLTLGGFLNDGNKNSAAKVERVVNTAATSKGSNEREKKKKHKGNSAS